MRIEQNGSTVIFHSNSKEDNEFLDSILKYINTRQALLTKNEILEGRVSAAQVKMHEATTISADLKKKLFKMEKSWVYKIFKFIKEGCWYGRFKG